MSLYLFWTIVQFPLQFYMRGYHQAGILPGLLQALKNVVLGYGFTGSWFIVALVVGILLVFWLSKKIPSGWLVVLTLPSYILCCLATNYYRISDGVFGARAIINGYQALAGLGINNSFLAALLWVSVGKALADRKWAIKTTMLWVAAGFFAVLLWLEWYLIKRASLCELEDCYFMLMLVCPTIFLLFSRSKLSFVSRVRIRELSTIIYVTHGCCGRILGYALKMLPIPSAVQIGMKMLLSFAAAMVVCQLLVYLREKKNLKIFGYAY